MVFGTAGALACLVMLGDTPARACGGCFSQQQTQNPTVVTDHRMILSVSVAQTTLYDQIGYSGSPESFAWVLPIAGTANVGLSADVVFDSLNALTQTTIYAPPHQLPCRRPQNCNSFGARRRRVGGVRRGRQHPQAGGRRPVRDRAAPGDRSASARQWLTSHGYAVPGDIEPSSHAYVSEGFDFLAMKLVPGAGRQVDAARARHDRGRSPSLPLRMVAAGTGATVGITLWVVGEGRYEPQNFPWFRIEDSELVWDLAARNRATTRRSARRRSKRRTAPRGRFESSLPLDVPSFTSYVDNGGFSYPYYGYDAGSDYLPVDAPDGGDAGGETASQVRDDDLATLFEGMSPSNVRVTRIRADLSRTALAQDLALEASSDQSVLTNLRYVKASVGSPVCPSYGYCGDNGGGPNGNNVSSYGGCAMSPSGDETGTLWTVMAGLAMAAYGLARRKKR